MKIAIMQPYIFPYIGYYQLINAVDKFVIYDDVSFIKRGWINRNKILVNRNEHMFTVPLSNASQNVLIRDLKLAVTEKWKNKIFKTLEYAYSRAPYYENTMSVLTQVINTKTNFILDWHLYSFELIARYLNINTVLVSSSNKYKNESKKGQHRILDICLLEKADDYVNPISGKALYDRELFLQEDIILKLLSCDEILYPQYDNEFVANLSIIDVMMFNSAEKIKNYLKMYKLV
jgi:hypothetical protein